MDKRQLLVNQIKQLQNSALLAREAFMRRFLDPRRNIEAECGHPISVTTQDCKNMYTRGDVARRVVEIYPDETWSQDPEVYETEEDRVTPFEKAWTRLNRKHSLVTALHHVDVLSGIGRFGILLLGLDDGRKLEDPVDTEGARKLLYLRTFDETVVKVETFNNDPTSERFGQPDTYSIQFADSVEGIIQPLPANVTTLNRTNVHWSRVVHVADNRVNSQVFGLPRIECVANRLADLAKVAGGSAEMFWKGGFPGLSLQSHPNTTGDEIEFDEEASIEQMEAYMNGLQRFIATVGMDVKSLTVQLSDPRPFTEVHLRLIATAMAVPWRIFTGSESAHLASSQDSQTWNHRLARRRKRYVTPFIIRPFVDRLVQYQILPRPKEDDGEAYIVWWPDLDSPSGMSAAEVAEKKTNAIAKYVQAGGDALIDPYHYLTLILQMSEAEANAIISDVGDDLMAIDVEPSNARIAGRNGDPALIARNSSE